jgi:hypothetical protein
LTWIKFCVNNIISYHVFNISAFTIHPVGLRAPTVGGMSGGAALSVTIHHRTDAARGPAHTAALSCAVTATREVHDRPLQDGNHDTQFAVKPAVRQPISAPGLAIPLILAAMAQLARLQIDLDPDRGSDLSGRLAKLGGEILTTNQSGATTPVVSGCRNPVTPWPGELDWSILSPWS